MFFLLHILIYRINYPSTNKTAAEVILIGNSPFGIAVDSIHDHIYWSSYGTQSIYRSFIDGSNTTTTVFGTGNPTDLHLDMINGYS